MWHPWRTEQTQYLMVYWDLNTFTLVLPSSSHWSYHCSFPVFDNPTDMHAKPCTAHSDGMVPHAVPPLPLSESHPKHPRLSSNPRHCISVNPLHPMFQLLISLHPGLLLMGLPGWILRALITPLKLLSRGVLSWHTVSFWIPLKTMLLVLPISQSFAMTFIFVKWIICPLLITLYFCYDVWSWLSW